MANKNLTNAKRVKNDEFYTQYSDIQKEIEAYLEYSPDVFASEFQSCSRRSTVLPVSTVFHSLNA